MNKKLANISSSFCFHPWTQLATNPLGELMNCCMQHAESGLFFDRPGNIETYWNSEPQKELRRDLLAGKRPSICSGCWNSESGGMRSKRQHELHYAPAAGIGEEQVMSLVAESAKANGHCASPPTYLDLKLSNKCNLKCRMCAPENSHLIHAELLDYSQDFKPLESYYHYGLQSEARPRWSSEITVERLMPMSRGLKRINISGGEPLLNPLVPQFLEALVKEDLAKDIHLTFNTNGLLKNPFLYGLFSQFKKVDVYISVDGIEKIYEYIRYPAEWNVLDRNMDHFMEYSAPNVRMIVSPTLQVLNALSIDKIYNWSRSKGARFAGGDHVTFPGFHSAVILPATARRQAIERLEKLNTKDVPGASDFPLEQIVNFLTVESENIHRFQRDFVIHTNLLDKIRGQSIRESCPELFAYIEDWFSAPQTSTALGGAHE